MNKRPGRTSAPTLSYRRTYRTFGKQKRTPPVVYTTWPGTNDEPCFWRSWANGGCPR